MPVCPSCGQKNPEGFRLCGMCGAQLAPAEPASREVRKTVTVVFTDVTGSTALGERLDPESLRRVLDDAQPQIGWRTARVRVLVERGQLQEAAEVGRTLLRLAERSDFLVERADAFLALAHAARAGGRADEAAGLLRRALADCERKGNVVSAARVRAILAEIPA